MSRRNRRRDQSPLKIKLDRTSRVEAVIKVDAAVFIRNEAHWSVRCPKW